MTVALAMAGVACGQSFSIAGDGGADRSATDHATADQTPVEVGPGESGGGDAGFCDDCSSPACLELSECVPDESGWTHVSFEAMARTPCPDGYDTPDDVAVAGGKGMCDCTCGGGVVTCAPGGGTTTLGVAYGMGTCTSTEMASTTGCSKLSTPIATGSNMKFTPLSLPPMVSACTSISKSTIPLETAGRTCTVKASSTKGCKAGDVCVPRPGKEHRCIAQPGSVACPAGFPATYQVATKFTSTRACSPCACAPSGAAAGCKEELDLFTDTGCGTLAGTVADDMTCSARGIASPILSVKLTVTSEGGGCTGTSVATGSETPIAGAQTLCCLL